MKANFLRLVALLLCAAPALAQQMPAHVMTGDPDYYIYKTGDYAPRAANQPGVKAEKWPDGYVISENKDLDAIEFDGHVTLDQTKDITIKVTDLQGDPENGFLDLNVPCGHTFKLLLKSKPLDLSRDPYQWTHSALVHKQIRINGCAVAMPYVPFNDLHKGDTSTKLRALPTGWKVGGEILPPDTDQQPASENGVTKFHPKREPKLTIVKIDGNEVFWDTPLTFDHLVPRLPDGSLPAPDAYPTIAYLTRNVTIESEAKNFSEGTPTHFAIMHGATGDIRYAEFIGGGRTTIGPLDNTVGDMTHIGTRQLAKYVIHFHVAQGYQSFFIGNTVRCSPGAGKWGVVSHNTPDLTISKNVVVDCDGAGIVTEAGAEVRNVITDNWVAYSGSHVDDVLEGIINSPEANMNRNAPGSDGGCYWFNGVHGSTIDRNQAYNCRFGMVIINRPSSRAYPSRPGGPLDSQIEGGTPNQVLASFTGNYLIANMVFGLDSWRVRGAFPGAENYPDAFVIRGLVSGNNAFGQGFMGAVPISSGGSVYIDSTLFGTGYTSPCLIYPRGYTFELSIINSNLRGCHDGLLGGGGRSFTLLKDGTWQNHTNYNGLGADQIEPGSGLFMTGITFVPVPGQVLPAAAKGVNVLSWGNEAVWLPKDDTGYGDCNQFVPDWWQGTSRSVCLRGGTPGSPPPVITPPEPITQCNDGIDNDLDGFVDANDKDCTDAEDNDELGPPVVTPPEPPKSTTLDLKTTLTCQGADGSITCTSSPVEIH